MARITNEPTDIQKQIFGTHLTTLKYGRLEIVHSEDNLLPEAIEKIDASRLGFYYEVRKTLTGKLVVVEYVSEGAIW